MDPQVGASFIPKASIAEAQRGSPIGLLFLIALLIFIASIVAGVAAFLYTISLQNKLVEQDAMLKRQEAAFDITSIEDLSRLDQRIINGQNLLATHVAPSALFDFLAAETLTKVQFTNFSYTLNKEGSAVVTMSGVADSFASVALQSDRFGSSKELKDVVFSDITNASDGRINFGVSATVDAGVILYAKTYQNAAPVVVPETAAPAASSTQP